MHPRLLIISPSAFNPLSGGGITFTNLFHGWPKDKIATAHSDQVEPTTEVCEKYYRLGRKEFPWMFPFSLANFFGGQEKVEGKMRTARSSGKRKNLFESAMHFLQRGVQSVFGEEIPMHARISNELREWIRVYKPEVIYTILGSLQYIRLVRAISHEFKLPVVIHMMDDWPQVLYKKGIFGPYRRRRMRIELQELISEAAACLSICDAMSEAYEKRYKQPFQAFHNAVDASVWLKKARTEWKRVSPFKIIYAGALMVDSQLQSVADTADAVAALHREGLDIELKIFAPWYFANRYRYELARPGCVSMNDAPAKMDIEELFASADLLLLPVNFDERSTRYIRYSMPTKVPAYMFSGTPTLAYGPADVASIGYAQKEHWAYCVTKRNAHELKDAIKKLVEDESLREKLALHAQKVAQKNHDRANVASQFQHVIAKAANGRAKN